jgi:hypothetical protein
MKIAQLFVVALVLSACGEVKVESPPQPGAGYVLEGGVISGTETAVIAIAVMKDGMPTVLVDPIIVNEGQRVVWAGPESMTIRFPQETPFEKSSFTTQDAVINALVPRLKSDKKQEEFKYDIIVNGVTLDPVMIVRKQF